ncbi:MAG: hypothetical protein LBK67_12245 [Coriobacteriales bacterium]|jgi:hypothetical protein|nr:hypothetical protein [Coriobacteriales bacterium]
MRYFFSEDRFGNTVTFNDVQSVDNAERIPFYIEQMRIGDAKEPFNYAEGYLPEARFTKTFGFSPSELERFQDYLLRNSDLFFEIAREKAEHL